METRGTEPIGGHKERRLAIALTIRHSLNKQKSGDCARLRKSSPASIGLSPDYGIIDRKLRYDKRPWSSD